MIEDFFLEFELNGNYSQIGINDGNTIMHEYVIKQT